MEPMGQCPVCDHKIAPSCQVCPQCGNTDWWRKTGKTGERLAHLTCPSCLNDTGDEGGINRVMSCERCNRKGFLQEKRGWFEWMDTRNGRKHISDLEISPWPSVLWL